MCKVLADLLGIDDPLFSVGVHQLELASGQPGVDVRLYAEIIRKAHQKTRELGLDPKDTTGKELYHALMELTKKHDEFLAHRLGVRDSSDTAQVLAHAKKFVDSLDIPKNAWVIKQSVARRLLKTTPPKKLMSALGYRSVDSMIKREDSALLFAALRFTESSQWLQGFTRKYKNLKPSDFEMRRITVIHLQDSRLTQYAKEYVARQHHNLTHMKEMGVIALLPLPMERMRGVTIAVLPLLLHYLHEIRMYSAYFKLNQVKKDFGEVVAQTINHDPHNHAKVAGHDVHWRTVHRHFGGHDKAPEMFEPHVQPDDLWWRKAEDILYRAEPALHFWYGMDFVASHTKSEIVSFNLMDMAVNYVNQLPYGKHVVNHFQAALWNELFIRYIGEPALEYQIIQQLGSDMAARNEANLEELFL